MPIFQAWSARTGCDCMGSPIEYGFFEADNRGQVLAYVSQLPGWHNYSDDGGGTVVEIHPVKLDKESINKRLLMLKSKEQLERQLAEINAELRP